MSVPQTAFNNEIYQGKVVRSLAHLLARFRVTRNGTKLKFHISLIVITAFGTILRIAFMLSYTQYQSTFADYNWYSSVGLQLSRFQDPLYPGQHYHTALLPIGLSIFFAIGDWLGFTSVHSQVLEFTLLAVIAVPFIGILGNAIAGSRVGLFSATLTAIDPRLFVNYDRIFPEPLTFDLQILALIQTYAIIRKGSSLLRIITLGIILGASIYSESESAISAGLIIMGLAFIEKGNIWKKLRIIIVSSLVISLLISPWTIRNYRDFHAFVPMSANLGITLLGSNCPSTYYSANRIGVWNQLFCVLTHPTHTTNEVISDREWTHIALQYIKEHPTRALLVATIRLLYPFGFYHPGVRAVQQNFSITNGYKYPDAGYVFFGFLFWLGYIWFWVLAIPAATGFWIMHKQKRYPFFLSTEMISTAITLFFFHSTIRLTMNFEIAFCIFVGICFDNLIARHQRKSTRGLP